MKQLFLLILILLNSSLLHYAFSANASAKAKSLTASQNAFNEIQATRNSPFFCMRGSWRKAIGHGTPSSYKLVPNSRKVTFTVKSYYLVNNRATLVVKDFRQFDMVDTQTNKTVKFQEMIVEQEIWLKLNHKWFLKFVKHLPGYYLVDGVTPPV